MKKKVIYTGLALFGVIACMPFIQHLFSPFKLVGLTGAFEVTEKPVFKVDNFLNGKYQTHTDYYIKDNAPFKGDFVRLRNQLNYFFFNEINTTLTLGKQNYLFDPNYIAANCGTDLLPDSQFVKFEKDLTQSFNLLKKLNVPILFCIAPNKARFYEEFIPQQLCNATKTNRHVFVQILKQKNIPVVDFDDWFVNLKGKTNYVLIPKYGAHWSTYGAFLAADSLLKVVSKITNAKTPFPRLISLTTSNNPKYSDDDYLSSLNLIWKWKSDELTYPTLKYTSGSKINVLTISDSFIWNFYDLEVFKHVMDDSSQTWYYNKAKYDVNRNKIGTCSTTININDIKNRDAIIIMATAPSLVSRFYTFFDQLSEVSNL